MDGDLRAAHDAARDAWTEIEARLVRGEPIGGEPVARAAFELAFIGLWLGRLHEVEEVLARFFDGSDSLAHPRWVAWALFERGSLRIGRGAPRDAIHDLLRARELLAALHIHHGVAAAWLVRSCARRLAGDVRAASIALDAASLVIDEHRLATHSRHALLFERGDLARTRGDLDDARDNFAQILAGRPGRLHRGLAELGLAEVSRAARSVDVSHLRTAQQYFRDISSGLGLAHCLVTSALMGLLEPDDARIELERIGFGSLAAFGVSSLDPSQEAWLHPIAFP